MWRMKSAIACWDPTVRLDQAELAAASSSHRTDPGPGAATVSPSGKTTILELPGNYRRVLNAGPKRLDRKSRALRRCDSYVVSLIGRGVPTDRTMLC